MTHFNTAKGREFIDTGHFATRPAACIAWLDKALDRIQELEEELKEKTKRLQAAFEDRELFLRQVDELRETINTHNRTEPTMDTFISTATPKTLKSLDKIKLCTFKS
jgi:hypothetical protein